MPRTQNKTKFTKEGYEIPDCTPMEIPVGHHIPKNWQTGITDLIRKALNEKAEESGHESFEEANDFDCPEEDEELARTPYEEHFDHEENFINDVKANIIRKMKEKEEELKPKKKSRRDHVAKGGADAAQPEAEPTESLEEEQSVT